MADEKLGVSVGCKIPEWKRKALREAAHRRRTTISALLRERVNHVLEEDDIDRSDIPDYGAEDANE